MSPPALFALTDGRVGSAATGGPRREEAERGSAVVEFLGAGLLLLVPLVYLVLTLAQVQAAVFAAEGAAREAGRHLAHAESIEEGMAAAREAVRIAFEDQGVDAAPALSLDCAAKPCLTPGERILVRVEGEIGLPFLPPVLREAIAAVVPVAADHTVVVPRFREAG